MYTTLIVLVWSLIEILNVWHLYRHSSFWQYKNDQHVNSLNPAKYMSKGCLSKIWWRYSSFCHKNVIRSSASSRFLFWMPSWSPCMTSTSLSIPMNHASHPPDILPREDLYEMKKPIIGIYHLQKARSSNRMNYGNFNLPRCLAWAIRDYSSVSHITQPGVDSLAMFSWRGKTEGLAIDILARKFWRW